LFPVLDLNSKCL